VKFKVILITFLITSIISFAQDVHFSQFYANPLYLAPSFAGGTKGTRVVLNYRNQFPVYNVFSTYSFSIDHYFHRFQSGLGLLILSDRAGQGRLGTTNIGIQYAFHVILNNSWNFRPGVSFVYAQRSIDMDALVFPDELGTGNMGSAVRFDYNYNRREAFDFSTSTLFHNNRHWFGITVDHLMRPKLGFTYENYRLPVKYMVYGGTEIIRKGRLIRSLNESISPSFLYYQQGKNRQLIFGGYWYRDPVIFGVWLRGMFFEYDKFYNRDALIFIAGYRDEKYAFTYSFDFNISNILLRAAGSHEISLSYKFNQEWEKKKRPKKKAIPCPTF